MNREKQPNHKIIHHGAVDGVTGSCHQLFFGSAVQEEGQEESQEENASSILIDCGLFQGDESNDQGINSDQLMIGFPVDNVVALVVTHVHIDHVGNSNEQLTMSNAQLERR